MAEFRIYLLADPTTQDVRYVGQTRHRLSTRLAAHLQAARKGERTLKADWIRALRKIGQLPLIVHLEETDHPDEREIFWVKQFRNAGCPLTNMTEGGLANRAMGGERNHRARLTWAQVRAIRAEPRTLSRKEVAQKYGMTRACVTSVLLGKSWRDPDWSTQNLDYRTCLRLTEAEIREIRRLFVEERVKVAGLMQRFSISKTHLYRVIRGARRRDKTYEAPAPIGPTVGELNGCSKLTWEKVRAIRAEPKGQRLGDLAAKYGISRSSVSFILLNERWVDAAYESPGTRQAQGMPWGGNSKLDWDTARAIRAEPKDTPVTALATKYGVSRGSIRLVLQGKTWKEHST